MSGKILTGLDKRVKDYRQGFYIIPWCHKEASPISLDFLLRSRTYLKEHPPSVSIANSEFPLSYIIGLRMWFSHTTSSKLEFVKHIPRTCVWSPTFKIDHQWRIWVENCQIWRYKSIQVFLYENLTLVTVKNPSFWLDLHTINTVHMDIFARREFLSISPSALIGKQQCHTLFY